MKWIFIDFFYTNYVSSECNQFCKLLLFFPESYDEGMKEMKNKNKIRDILAWTLTQHIILTLNQ